MASKSIVTSTRSHRSSSKSDASISHSIDNEDKIVGHCSISLEQLCKVALANAATTSASVAAPRILIHRGRPMHNLDSKTLQVRSIILMLFYSLLCSCNIEGDSYFLLSVGVITLNQMIDSH